MGPLLCLVSAVCFGAMGIFGKLAYQAGVSPSALLLLRFTLAAALLGLLLVMRPGLRRRIPMSVHRGGRPTLSTRRQAVKQDRLVSPCGRGRGCKPR